MKIKSIVLAVMAAAVSVSLNAKEIKVALACSSACEAYHDNDPKRDNDPRRLWGWGEVLHLYMDKDVKILNFAKSGRSTVTFRKQGYWKKLIDSKPDYVIMALGANDSKPGPKHSDANTSFKENLRNFYKEAQAIGAKTIFVTLNQSMVRGKDGKPHFSRGKILRKDRVPYSQAIREVAKEFNAPCLELFDRQKEEMEKIGEAECAKLYRFYDKSDRQDPSHTNLYGAHFVANIIAGELAKADTPLASKVMTTRLWKSELVPGEKAGNSTAKTPAAAPAAKAATPAKPAK